MTGYVEVIILTVIHERESCKVSTNVFGIGLVVI